MQTLNTIVSSYIVLVLTHSINYVEMSMIINSDIYDVWIGYIIYVVKGYIGNTK